MEIKKITLRKTLSIWWSMIWRAIVASVIIGFVLGFLGGVIAGATGNSEFAGIIGGMIGWIGSVPVSIWALNVALTKRYGSYSVMLVQSPHNHLQQALNL